MIRAVVVDPSVTGCLSVQEVAGPTAGPAGALVRVRAVSLNPGEVRRAQTAPAGDRIGGDFAGVVETAAADGSGPAAGARVVGLSRPTPTGWSEVVAATSASLAVLPDTVTFEQAATLPVAGLTALHSLRKGGTLVGQRVLITGASGGVGHYAVQLARHAGAIVVAQIRRDSHVDLVREAGAAEVVVDESGGQLAAHGPYHLVVDAVGGTVLASALAALAQGGVCVQYGASSGNRIIEFNTGDFFRNGPHTFYGLYLGPELGVESAGDGLAILANLVAAGHLRPLISVEAPWTQVGEVAQQLLERRYVGKAILRLD
jgi:NADPH:quinone reductase-like Zn-dependent oxidoreductase